MDTSTAVEECESSLSLLRLWGIDPSTLTTENDLGEQEDDDLSAFIPDPTVIMEPDAEEPDAEEPDADQQSASIGSAESGRAWGSDKCVMMRCYHPGSDESSRYRVVVSEKPVLITELRFAEQNVAYETLLAKAPAGEIQKHYRLHLARLEDIREHIASSGRATERLQYYHVQYHLHLKEHLEDYMKKYSKEYPKDHLHKYLKGKLAKAKSQSEFQRVEKGSLAYKKMVKLRDKLKACERAVARLLVKCEDAGKEEPGFEKVNWQTDQ